MSQPVEFIPLLNFEEDYEILNQYPFTIRRKDNHHEVKESLSHGYVQIHLNNKVYSKHVLIALQFIPNDDIEHKNQIDHINRNRSDNLRWVSTSDNLKNKSSHHGVQYNFIDNLDNDAIVVNDYGIHKFEDYYYSKTNDKFYFWNGVKYRELHNNESKKDGKQFVVINDMNDKRVKVFYSKFKRLYDLV